MIINTKQIGVDARTVKWNMDVLGNNLKFSKNVGTEKNPQFSYFFLKRVGGGTKVFEMTFPEVKFVSKTSFFTTKNETETHFKRAKPLINSMFSMLKKVGLQPLISNWDKVVMINKYNPKSDKDVALQELQKMTSPKSEK